MKKYVNVVITDSDGNKETKEKAIVVSLQKQGTQSKVGLSLVHVDTTDFVMIICALLKMVDDYGLSDAVLKIAPKLDPKFERCE